MKLGFDKKFKKAFLEVIIERESRPILSSFENSYNYKCKNSWENEYKDRNSLGYALHEALHGYPKYDPQDLKDFTEGEISNEFHEKMKDILNQPIMMEIIEDFKRFIKNAHGIDPESAQIPKLKSEIKSGLADYGKYKTRGMSIDPVP